MKRPMYNQEIKEKFLESYYNEATRNTYRRILEASAEIERELQKDMHDWNAKEIIEFLHTLKPETWASSSTNGRIVTAYIDFAIEQGLREYNPTKAFDSKYFNRFVAVDRADLYITETALNEMNLVNAQDSAILQLLFEGAQGTGVSEICRLKKTDIQGNVLHLTDDDGNTRTLTVSDKCIALVEQAATETEYWKKNGEMRNPTGKLKTTLTLVDNAYVFRNSITRTDKWSKPVDKHTIYRRIKRINELFGMPHLEAKHVAQSGMVFLGKKLFEEYSDLDKPQYTIIAERFGMARWWDVKKYVTVDLLKSKYGEE